MNRDAVKKELLLGYFFLSPIYWIPGVGVGPIFWLKTIYWFGLILLFFPAGLSTIGKAYVQSKNGLLLLLLGLTTGLYVAIFYAGSLPTIVNAIVFIFLFVFAGYFCAARRVSLRMGPYSLFCFLLITALLIRVVLAIAIPGLDARNEAYTYSEYLGADFFLPLSISGYNLGRTGWSISLVLLVSFLSYLLIFNRGRASRALLFLLVALAVVCVAFSTSRTGVVGIAMFILLFFLVPKAAGGAGVPRRRFGWLKVATGLLVLLVIANYVAVNFAEQTRFDAFFGSSDIDVITNGRYSGVEIALEILRGDLWFGSYPVGTYNLLDYGLPYAAVHMVWLHLAASYGVLLALAWLVVAFTLFFRALYACLKISKRGEPQYLLLAFLLLFGMVSTLTEPETIISSGSHIAIYWFVIGYVCQKNSQDMALKS